ncbi:MAG: hypothetical protein JRI25_29855, partial [Deltaproteobacteria bacterium]|nr:hypothetical protein [Deltaproteobacteria bacterium]
TGVYDEDLLITGFLSAEEFGWVPEDVQAFVDFHRGVDLARRGSDAWADAVFAKLPSDSPYAARAEYVRAVRFVAEGEDAEAIASLEGLAERDDLPSDLEQEVERSLARLAFEEQRFEDALAHFQTLREQAPDDPEILLETAWTEFYLGDSRKTLGLLIALDAPVHRHYISPERYLLEALSLRRLCQFSAAREAAVRLRRKHGDSLDALATGKLPVEVPELHTAARLRGRSSRNARFTDRLQWERDRLAALRIDDGLRAGGGAAARASGDRAGRGRPGRGVAGGGGGGAAHRPRVGRFAAPRAKEAPGGG